MSETLSPCLTPRCAARINTRLTEKQTCSDCRRHVAAAPPPGHRAATRTTAPHRTGKADR